LRARRRSASLDVRHGRAAETAGEEAAVSDTGQPADGPPADERPGSSWLASGGPESGAVGDAAETDPASVPPPPPAQEAASVAGGPDVNLEAIDRAALDPQYASWLREVALQVDARLDRVEPGWRAAAQAPAARACAFGLLAGQLANDYPDVTDQLSRVVEAHPSFAALGSGRRLDTLREIARDRPRLSAWLSPLVEARDPEAVQRLLD
jgi:hypothetical protein